VFLPFKRSMKNQVPFLVEPISRTNVSNVWTTGTSNHNGPDAVFRDELIRFFRNLFILKKKNANVTARVPE